MYGTEGNLENFTQLTRISHHL